MILCAQLFFCVSSHAMQFSSGSLAFVKTSAIAFVCLPHETQRQY